MRWRSIRRRLPAWTNSRAGGAALTVVALAGVLGAAVGAGYSVSRPFLSDGSAYLAKGYTVAHVNGETGRSDAEVARQLATGKEPIEPVRLPDGRLAIVNNATGTVELVDTSTMTPSGAPVRRPDSKGEVKAISAASRGYLVDQKRNTVEQLATPQRPAPAAVPVPEGIEAAVPAGDSAWVLTRAGVVLEVAGDRVARTVRLDEPQVGLTVADGHPVAVTESGVAWVVDGGQPRRIGDMQAPGRRFALGSWQGADRYAVGVDTSAGRVVALDPRTERRIAVDLKVNAGRAQLGSPVVLGSRVYVPDRSGPRLWRVDLASGKADRKPLAVPGPAGRDFELKVSGGRVWANSQYDRRALVVDTDGHERYADKGPAPELNDSQAKDEAPTGEPTQGPPAPRPAGPALPAGPGTAPPRRSVTVPDINRGTPYEQACDRVREAGLRCSPVAVGEGDGLRTGDVVSTSPRGGRKVREGSRVVVRYAGPLRVPDVSGVPYREACAQIKSAGLTCTATADAQVAGSPEQLEAVTAQDPPAGEHVDRGSLVTVRYPPSIALPSLAGLRQGEACTRLKAYKMGCRATAGLPGTGAGKTPGTVYEQAPAAGAETRAHTTVTVTFYSGDNAVGTYTGVSQQEACAKIQADGFQCAAAQGISPVGQPGGKAGVVYRQTPPAGGRQDLGKPVTVTYYSGGGLPLRSYVGGDVNIACQDIQSRGYQCNPVVGLHPSTNVVFAQDQGPGVYPIGTAITVHYSPWRLVDYWIRPWGGSLQANEIVVGNPGGIAIHLGLGYRPGEQIPGAHVANQFVCTNGSCRGYPRGMFYSRLGPGSPSIPAGFAYQGPALTLMDCSTPGTHPVWRGWNAGSPRYYRVGVGPVTAEFQAPNGGSEQLGCAWN